MTFTVTAKAMRPASEKRECFYCHQPIGAEHKAGCVLINRKCKVRMIVEYEVDVPADWDKDMVEFHRNESSWCADNMLRELDDLGDKLGCLCPTTECEFVEFTSDAFLDE